MEFGFYFRVFRRWLWLVILASVVFASVGFRFVSSQTPQYTVTATVQVGATQDMASPSTDDILSSQQLASTYAVIVKTYPLLQTTIDQLHFDMKPADLNRYFQVNIVTNTALIQIIVTYPDATKAVAIANELATQLIALSPADQLNQQKKQETFLTDEFNAALESLGKARQELISVDAEIAASGSPVPTELAAHHTDLVAQINSEESSLMQMISNLANMRRNGSANSLHLVEAAHAPDRPTLLSTPTITGLAAILGAALASGVIFLIAFLSDSIRNPSELNTHFGLNIIAAIAPFGGKNTYRDKLIMWNRPQSAIAEGYRTLRDNLIGLAGDKPKEPLVYIITSANPGEGKSVTAANLAIAFALTGVNVLLVDAAFRSPIQHNFFNVRNNIGLLDVITHSKQVISSFPPTSKAPLKQVFDDHNDEAISDVTLSSSLSLLLPTLVSRTDLPGLDIIPAGSSSSLPPEILGTVQMQKVINIIAENHNYDVVIFDTPSLLETGDSRTLARITHAKVLMVVDPRRVRRGAILRAIQQFAVVSIPIESVVLNRLRMRDLESGYGVYSHGRYESAPSQNGKSTVSDT